MDFQKENLEDSQKKKSAGGFPVEIPGGFSEKVSEETSGRFCEASPRGFSKETA